MPTSKWERARSELSLRRQGSVHVEPAFVEVARVLRERALLPRMRIAFRHASVPIS